MLFPENPSYAYMIDLTGNGSDEDNLTFLRYTTPTRNIAAIGPTTGRTILCPNTKIRRLIATALCRSRRSVEASVVGRLQATIIVPVPLSVKISESRALRLVPLMTWAE